MFKYINNYLDNFTFIKDAQPFFAQNYMILLISSFLYCPVIFGTQFVIKNLSNPNCLDKPLKFPLFLWNMSLSIFSGIGAYHLIPYVYNMVKTHGFIYSACSQDYIYTNKVSFYIFLFVLSKIPELVDTLFIVLRNKPLITLHWYHHLATMLYGWHGGYVMSSAGPWFSSMNYFVHTIMYAYYAMACYYKISDPRFLTIMQITQMFMGILVTVTKLLYGNSHTDANTYMACAMYISYAYLFIDFYIKKYNKVKKN
jgi:hypothetical protein